MRRTESPVVSPAHPPSLEQLLSFFEAEDLIAEHGRTAVVAALQKELAAAHIAPEQDSGQETLSQEESLLAGASERLRKAQEPILRCVFNLTGSVLHAELGRALLPEEAMRAVTVAATEPCNLELDLGHGKRDDLLEGLLVELTGAEAATVVNNNAAAVLLALNTLAQRKEVVVSRGELVEIGGAFRVPEMTARAGCKLREVGTTNRTTPDDFLEAIGPRTRLILKVHANNCAMQGFAAAVAEETVASIARNHSVPFMVDLGSGTLVDLERWGLPHEPTVQEALAGGADLVTFSGDKLLGGPQAGIIVGRADLIARIKRNPLRRALRVDKLTLAALEAVLRLYRDPDRLQERLTTLRLLTRSPEALHALAERLRPDLAHYVSPYAQVAVQSCASQIGSGALPVDRLAGLAFVITPRRKGRGAQAALRRIDRRFRQLPVPVIGRIHDDALWLDLRCLEDEESFLAQLPFLAID